jgi:hypothetical protein
LYSKLGVSCRPRREEDVLWPVVLRLYRSLFLNRCLACSRTNRVEGHGIPPARHTDTGGRPLSGIRSAPASPPPPGEDEDVVQQACQQGGQNGHTWTMAALVRTSKNLTHLLMCDRRNSKLTVESRGRVACRCARNRGSHHTLCSSLALPGLGLVDPSPGAHPLARLARRFWARAVISAAPRKHLRRKKLGARATPSRTEIRMKLNGEVVRGWPHRVSRWRARDGSERNCSVAWVPE